MTVTELWFDRSAVWGGYEGHTTLDILLKIASVCNNAVYVESCSTSKGEDGLVASVATGSASEVALLNFCSAIRSIATLRAAHPVLFEVPFNSVNKWHLVVTRQVGAAASAYTVMMKGAPEVILGKCTHYLYKVGDRFDGNRGNRRGDGPMLGSSCGVLIPATPRGHPG